MDLLLFLISLATPFVVWWRLGWEAAVAAFVAMVIGYTVGYRAMQAALNDQGYEVSYRADATGQKRWRVGVPSGKVQTIDWVQPASTKIGR